MSFSPCSAADRPEGGVLPAEGLPPLPKGLSGILSSSGGPWRDVDKVRGVGARTLDDARREDATHAQSSLDVTLAQLQKDMVDLRQMDASLLSQLCSLHEDIQEFKHSSLLSEDLFEADNGYSEEEEEDGEVEEQGKEETEVVSQSPPSFLSSSPPSSQ